MCRVTLVTTGRRKVSEQPNAAGLCCLVVFTGTLLAESGGLTTLHTY